MAEHSTAALRWGALCVITCCIFVTTGVEAFRNLQVDGGLLMLHGGTVGEGEVMEVAAAPASTQESVQSALTFQEEQDKALATCKANFRRSLCYPLCSKIAPCKICHKAWSNYYCDYWCMAGSFLASNKKSCTPCPTGSYSGGKLGCRHAHAICILAMLYTFWPHLGDACSKASTPGPQMNELGYDNWCSYVDGFEHTFACMDGWLHILTRPSMVHD